MDQFKDRKKNECMNCVLCLNNPAINSNSTIVVYELWINTSNIWHLNAMQLNSNNNQIFYVHNHQISTVAVPLCNVHHNWIPAGVTYSSLLALFEIYFSVELCPVCCWSEGEQLVEVINIALTAMCINKPD